MHYQLIQEKMIRYLISGIIVIVVGFTACTKQNNTSDQPVSIDTTTTQIENPMKNLISIVEIPTTDFARAVSFYQSVLSIKIEEVDMDGVQMGVLPTDGETVNVVLVRGAEYKPSVDGTIVYLHAGDDLQIALNKIESNGGKVIVPKTEISPEMGFFAMFLDTEGNKLGLHSAH